ncbi:MAG: Lrp/AsnC family transcriptional regulator [Opitutales bacterium]
MLQKVLSLLLEGEAVSTAEMATILGASTAEVDAALAALKAEGTLLGWRPVLHPNAVGENIVRALIEVSVIPEREGGFNRIAERIARFDEVETCNLMSGGYDLMVVVTGPNLLSVATFVAEKLATLGSVQSTATRFILRSYKESGFLVAPAGDGDERPAVSP